MSTEYLIDIIDEMEAEFNILPGDAIDNALEFAFNSYSLTEESREDFIDAGLMPSSVPLGCANRVGFNYSPSQSPIGFSSDIISVVDDDDDIFESVNPLDLYGDFSFDGSNNASTFCEGLDEEAVAADEEADAVAFVAAEAAAVAAEAAARKLLFEEVDEEYDSMEAAVAEAAARKLLYEEIDEEYDSIIDEEFDNAAFAFERLLHSNRSGIVGPEQLQRLLQSLNCE